VLYIVGRANEKEFDENIQKWAVKGLTLSDELLNLVANQQDWFFH
jgi:hypothetical protein